MYFPRNVAVLICLVLTIVVCVSGQDTKTQTTKTHKSNCESHKTCGECISTSYCQWCSEERPMMTHDQSTAAKSSGTGPPARCIDNRGIIPENWCLDSKTIINPSAGHRATQDDDFSNTTEKEIQLRPQKLNVQLRVDKEEKVKIKYKQALGYPVDLYFLMDLSFSMERHRDNLSGLGQALSEAMRSITSNFRLGFGSFVDKYILPMTSTQPEWLNNYCKFNGGKSKCATPYDFQHQMSLTNDHTLFKDRVNKAPISGNIDTPEGGLDALMQAMVCDKAIGWRPKARHIIVYSSDATYHIAGDGRLAGLIEPNDEQCHLNEKGLYDHAEILDYPSISQIKKIALDKSKSIIFAVTDEVKTDYNELSDYINPELGVGTLSENSDDVVKLVKTFTEKLTSNIKMVDRIDEKFADMFKIDYEAKYTGSIGGVVCKKNNCSGVSDKTPIEFEVSIKALRCPELKADRHQKIELELEGIPEKVVIDVDIICSCDCDSDKKVDSPACSNHGDLTCGVCECKPGYEHNDCSCHVQNMEFGNTDKCKAPNSNLTCSGHGTCNSCGTCMCNPGPDGDPGKKYSGDFCECDNFSCPRANFNNLPCGGPQIGECICGKCECRPGYEGESCGCRTIDACIAPGDEVPCSGFGDCECGVCQCTKDNRRSGKFCEQCTICVNQLCDKNKDCVECLAYQSGPKYTENENCLSCTDDIDFAGKVENLNETVNGTNYCTLLDSAGCVFAFTYEEGRGDAGKLLVRAEKDKKCPAGPANPLTVAISAIALTLFLGLLGLIIWKILTMYHDRREWAKFEKERASAKWERGDNPLFKDPTTRTANPIFEQQSTK